MKYKPLKVSGLGDLTIHRRVLDYLDRNMIAWYDQNDKAMSVTVEKLHSRDKDNLINLGAVISEVS